MDVAGPVVGQQQVRSLLDIRRLHRLGPPSACGRDDIDLIHDRCSHLITGCRAIGNAGAFPTRRVLPDWQQILKHSAKWQSEVSALSYRESLDK
jgi:hypothetical protein